MDRKGRGIALTLLIVLVAVGVCLIDDGHANGGELCGSAVLTAAVPLAVASLVPTDRCLPGPAVAYRFAPGDRPAPPPKA